MCDTLIALGNATADHSVLFAKNSDREPNEAHEVIIVPGGNHLPGSTVQCTYLSIPQVEKTNQVLLAKPAWIWGAEMGANEHGVLIGNEAVFTRVPYEKGPGLTGMDFIRLALERANTARAALDTIVSLLETYGQGGNCGFAHPFYYHNSFIIGDRQDAWVLETAGKHWAAVQVRDVRSISNAITIGQEWDLASKDLVDFAVDRRWCRRRDDFNFARCYSDPVTTMAAHARQRQCFTMDFLKSKRGQLTPAMCMSLLRDHRGAAPKWKLDRSLSGTNICMHAGFGPIRINQSVGSMVSHLTSEAITHWITGTSAPCTSIFKPVWLEAGLPDVGPSPKGEYDPATLWWRHERLHRATIEDYDARIACFEAGRDQIEAKFIREAEEVRKSSREQKSAFTERCFEEADQAELAWTQQVEKRPVVHKPTFYYRYAWQKFNKAAHWRE